MFFEIVGVVEQEQFVERFVYDKAVKDVAGLSW
jgi:hypothetical protein